MLNERKIFVSFKETNEGGVPIWPEFSDQVNEIIKNKKRIFDISNKIKEMFGTRISAYFNIITDLINQGVQIEIGDEGFWFTKPESSREITKLQILARRNASLQKEAIKKFIENCENNKTHESIKMLFHDGKDLVEKINKNFRDNNKINEIIDPKIEFVEDKIKDDVTGLYIKDIWRYCRLTWSLEHQSVPGRQIPFIIRNHAFKNKYIMGIGCLVSPILQHDIRDNWIGWTVKNYSQKIADGSLDILEFLKLLQECITLGIKDINLQNLNVSKDVLLNPTSTDIIKLQRELNHAKDNRIEELTHHEDEYRKKTILKELNDEEVLKISNTKALWITKRIALLSKFLNAQLYLNKIKNLKFKQEKIFNLLMKKEGKEVVNFLITGIRINGISSQVVDLNVCGALPPYNHLIAGKLVALSCASDELQQFYSNKYKNIPGEISSYIAGRKIYRSTKLEIMTTTSIYGKYPSQYNRLKLSKTNYPKLKFDLNLEKLKLTQGKGILHLSPETSKIFKNLYKEERGFSQVNNVFGEGTAPKLRNIATVLSMLNLPSEWILNHNQRRLFLCMEINKDARKNICNIFDNEEKTHKPKFIDISDAWLQKWVTSRLRRKDILDKIKDENFEKLSNSLKPHLL